MGAYAEVAHVRARAGYLGAAWTEESSPSVTDIEGFVEQVAAEIDAAIAGLGVSLPTPGSTAASALTGLNADGALLLALSATFPAGEGPAAATELQKDVERRYALAWKALIEGKHPATTSTASTGVPSATSFWDENPTYGECGDPEAAPFAPSNPSLDPAVYRGMGF